MKEVDGIPIKGNCGEKLPLKDTQYVIDEEALATKVPVKVRLKVPYSSNH